MSTDCILWTGALNEDGYGRVSVAGRQGLAHRVVWEDRHGPIPPGMQVDHACHNATGCHLGQSCPHRRCVNVDHLQLVTPRVNQLLKLAPIGWSERILTHCLRDHPRIPENTYYGRDGRRRCLACRAEDQRRRAARRDRAARELAGQLVLF
jgi:hypothetical protein